MSNTVFLWASINVTFLLKKILNSIFENYISLNSIRYYIVLIISNRYVYRWISCLNSYLLLFVGIWDIETILTLTFKIFHIRYITVYYIWPRIFDVMNRIHYANSNLLEGIIQRFSLLRKNIVKIKFDLVEHFRNISDFLNIRERIYSLFRVLALIVALNFQFTLE